MQVLVLLHAHILSGSGYRYSFYQQRGVSQPDSAFYCSYPRSVWSNRRPAVCSGPKYLRPCYWFIARSRDDRCEDPYVLPCFYL